MHGPTRVLREPRFIIFYLGIILLLIFSASTEKSIRIGVITILLGEGLRIWATGYLRKSEILITTGPYALIRHPLYTGTFFIGLGFCLMGRQIYIVLIYLLAFIYFYREKFKKEEKHLSDKFGAEFETYKRYVPAFIPGLYIFSQEKRQGFNLGRFFTSAELITSLWVVFFLLIFHLREEIYQEKESPLKVKNLIFIIIAGLLFFLACFNSVLLKKKRK